MVLSCLTAADDETRTRLLSSSDHGIVPVLIGTYSYLYRTPKQRSKPYCVVYGYDCTAPPPPDEEIIVRVDYALGVAA
eukprot:scaffold319123_cov18-Prasinocladus_malaysianus.AAC.1